MTTGASETTSVIDRNRQSEGEELPIESSVLESAKWWSDFAGGWLLISGVLAAIAACATVFLAFKQWQAEKILDRHSEWRTASLEMETEALRLEGDKLQLKAAKAGETAAQANKMAAEATERAANAALELERYRAPRLLTERQLEAITEKSAPFAGTKFVSGLTPGSEESAVLLTFIESALVRAGWKHVGVDGSLIVVERQSKPAAAIVTVSGVVIRMHPDSEVALGSAVLAIGNALKDEGIKVVAERSSGNINPANILDVHVFVGPKQ